MAHYKVKNKQTGETSEVEAASCKQALYKLALDKSTGLDKHDKKREAGKLFVAMLKSHEALLINNPNQLNLFS